MKKFLSLALSVLMLLSLLAGCGGGSSTDDGAQQNGGSETAETGGKLVVYSALNEDNTIAMAEQFEKDTGIEVEYISLGGGDAVARVQAEMSNPQADFLVGGSVDLYGSLAEAGALLEYDSPNNDDLDARFNDPNHLWQGWYMGVLSIIINEERFQEELASQGLAEPATWDDLLDPAYDDVFVWANPTTAGGAYIATACQIFRLGEDAAWDYLKALDQNVHHYYQGAGDVISPVATGEFIASIAWAHDSFKTQQEGYPLKLIIPEQTAYEIGGAAIINGEILAGGNDSTALDDLPLFRGPAGPQRRGVYVSAHQGLWRRGQPALCRPEEKRAVIRGAVPRERPRCVSNETQ